MRSVITALAGLAALILSACSSEPRLQVVKDDRVELVEHAFYVYAFDTTREVSVRFEVDLVFGPEIDAYLVDRENYRLWENREDFDHYPYGGYTGIDGHWESQWIAMPANKRLYLIIRDSRSEGRTESATVDFRIEILG